MAPGCRAWIKLDNCQFMCARWWPTAMLYTENYTLSFYRNDFFNLLISFSTKTFMCCQDRTLGLCTIKLTRSQIVYKHWFLSLQVKLKKVQEFYSNFQKPKLEREKNILIYLSRACSFYMCYLLFLSWQHIKVFVEKEIIRLKKSVL